MGFRFAKFNFWLNGYFANEEGTKKDHAPVYRKHLRKDCKTFKTTLNNSNALTYMRESFQNWPFQVMLAAPFAVDTFYLMSLLLEVNPQEIFWHKWGKSKSVCVCSRSAVTLFQCLAAMPPEGNARAGTVPGCSTPDRGNREAKVGFEPLPPGQGLLTFYLAASRFEAVQEGCLPCIKFWFVHAVHRFLRLTPPYLLVVFIYAGLFPHLYDGPLFPQRIELTDVNYCRQHWWITYFSNFFYTKEQRSANFLPGRISIRSGSRGLSTLYQVLVCSRRTSIFTCLPWTWYLANEFQFSGFLAPVFITVTKWTSFDLLLVKPYTHWGTYTMGLFFGWILFKRKQQGTLRRNSRREQLFVVSALALVSTFCLSSLYGFGGATSTSGPHSLSKFTFTLNTALSRPAFALALAIVIYLCGTDNAPYFNAFLSWPGFRLPSQLTYGLSLIHPIYVYLILMRLQTPITLSSATLVILFVAVSVISFISSFFLFLVTEIPVRTLEQFYGRR
ncbi:hypothetical protein T265_05964 [Opisthorchis viverrini]|uniref:Acyltransferase 3 domain-containing protein n=1 Tax=Opisthorchis viverrini TaxID=6198 RepID=A0A074ZM38_OPIVI|nr:hypothetical protein T265_05964 [Opisthorchis viverrini]KER26827.1 hypothetical protein T265_05964 [Opisthorchis viverrini]